jgi:hypothetical protein
MQTHQLMKNKNNTKIESIKTKIKRLVLVLIGIVSCFAAVTRLPLYSSDAEGIIVSLPFPDYLIDLSTRCFSLSQLPFWRENVSSETLSTHLLNNLFVYRNGQLLSGDWVKPDYELGLAWANYPVFDDSENVIGYYGGALTACFSNTMIADPRTHFRLEIVDMDGKLLSFNWLVLRS